MILNYIFVFLNNKLKDLRLLKRNLKEQSVKMKKRQLNKKSDLI